MPGKALSIYIVRRSFWNGRENTIVSENSYLGQTKFGSEFIVPPVH